MGSGSLEKIYPLPAVAPPTTNKPTPRAEVANAGDSLSKENPPVPRASAVGHNFRIRTSLIRGRGSLIVRNKLRRVSSAGSQRLRKGRLKILPFRAYVLGLRPEESAWKVLCGSDGRHFSAA